MGMLILILIFGTKYSIIIVIKSERLYTENYKILMKEIKEESQYVERNIMYTEVMKHHSKDQLSSN